jgi:hypothetical protein
MSSVSLLQSRYYAGTSVYPQHPMPEQRQQQQLLQQPGPIMGDSYILVDLDLLKYSQFLPLDPLESFAMLCINNLHRQLLR